MFYAARMNTNIIKKYINNNNYYLDNDVSKLVIGFVYCASLY